MVHGVCLARRGWPTSGIRHVNGTGRTVKWIDVTIGERPELSVDLGLQDALGLEPLQRAPKQEPPQASALVVRVDAYPREQVLVSPMRHRHSRNGHPLGASFDHEVGRARMPQRPPDSVVHASGDARQMRMPYRVGAVGAKDQI